jgi:DNA repair exonuclease SbcCD ATPase subunit
MKNELIIAASADWHIGDHTQFSEIDDTGRPSRLRQYLNLANDFYDFAKRYNADVITVAGDIVDQATMKPMVADILKTTLDILGMDTKIPVILTHGQHDLDTKTEELAEWHSALSLVTYDSSNVLYASTPTVYEIEKFKIQIVPWNSNHELPPHVLQDAYDIFIGHGAVAGCSNYDGYIFKSGFDQEDLLKRFKLSIIGDIHNGQTFFNKDRDRIILQPGSPIQMDYKDSPVTGFWLCKVPRTGPVEVRFHPIEKIHPDFYHRFLYSEDQSQKSTRLVHYRYRKPKPQKEGKTGDDTSLSQYKRESSNVLEIGQRIIESSRIENQEQVSEVFRNLMDSIKSTSRKVSRSKLVHMSIKNFLSVGEFELNFKDFPENLVITGENGSGKTSLVEAIYWCITGSTTMGVSVNEVVNDYGTGAASVELTIEIGDTIYKFSRSREGGKPLFGIDIFNGEWQRFQSSRTSSTQEVAYELLGIGEWEIKLLCYFSAQQPTLFGSLGKSNRYSLVSTISGIDVIDKAREIITEKLNLSSREHISLESKIDTLKSVERASKDRISGYLSKKESQVSVDSSDIEEKIKSIKERIQNYPEEKAIREEIGQCYQQHDEYQKSINQLQSTINKINFQLENTTSAISANREKLKTALKGECPTCGQSLHDEKVVDDITSKIMELQSQMPDVRVMTTHRSEIEEIREKLDILLKKRHDLEKSIEILNTLRGQLSILEKKLFDLNKEKTDWDSLISEEMNNTSKISTDISREAFKLMDVTKLVETQTWIKNTLLKRNGLLMTELSKQAQVLLQEEVNTLTADEDFEIVVEEDLSLRAKFLDRDEFSYNRLSTGQGRVVDIIMMVALNNLFTRLYGLEFGVLGVVVFDEVLSFLHEKYTDLCFGIIQKSNVPKKLVITHDNRLISRFSHSISVTLEGKSSSTYTKNW